MSAEHPELDDRQTAYKAAVEMWISSIRREESLASVAEHSVTEIDQWEKAHLCRPTRSQHFCSRRDIRGGTHARS